MKCAFEGGAENQAKLHPCCSVTDFRPYKFEVISHRKYILMKAKDKLKTWGMNRKQE